MRWQYKVENFAIDEQIEEALNRLGDKGFEVVETHLMKPAGVDMHGQPSGPNVLWVLLKRARESDQANVAEGRLIRFARRTKAPAKKKKTKR